MASDSIGERIKAFRDERGLRLTELAERADISKGYLSSLEAGRARRPSGEVVAGIAEALGVTMNDLLGREPERSAVSPALKEFAARHRLPEADIQMLASINFRGSSPETVARWEHIYSAIRQSSWMDRGSGD